MGLASGDDSTWAIIEGLHLGLNGQISNRSRGLDGAKLRLHYYTFVRSQEAVCMLDSENTSSTA